MELTEKQSEGLKIAVDRYRSGKPYTVISGYAGTGKSTLIKFIIAALNIPKEEVAYIAYTGKAAEVLRHKGCPNACTAHKLLYYSTKTIDGKFIFKPKNRLDCPYRLIVVDEVSMLDKDLWDLLLTHRIPIIACGDPFQIPPIDQNKDNHVLDDPHIFLDEIMRQAQDNEIIQLSMKIRESSPIQYMKGKDIQVVPYRGIVDGMYLWADQIITAKNKTRHKINSDIRKILGRGEEPQVGDKIISLENHWGILDSEGESALVNGTIGYIKEVRNNYISFPIRPGFTIGPIPVYTITFESEVGEIFENVNIDKKYILTGEKSLSDKQEYWIGKAKNVPSSPCLFDYGFAITGHKAQGSQWNKVLVFEENFPREGEEHDRWLYTAATRASDKLVLLR